MEFAMEFTVTRESGRDPLVIFEGAVDEVDDHTATEHFENIQSTNWQTVRWKPPPPREHEDSPRIGWRWGCASDTLAVSVGDVPWA